MNDLGRSRSSTDNAQNVQEEVHNIQVEVNGSQICIVQTEFILTTAYNQLSIEDDVDTE